MSSESSQRTNILSCQEIRRMSAKHVLKFFFVDIFVYICWHYLETYLKLATCHQDFLSFAIWRHIWSWQRVTKTFSHLPCLRGHVPKCPQVVSWGHQCFCSEIGHVNVLVSCVKRTFLETMFNAIKFFFFMYEKLIYYQLNLWNQRTAVLYTVCSC
jgi:hypothetical protein